MFVRLCKSLDLDRSADKKDVSTIFARFLAEWMKAMIK